MTSWRFSFDDAGKKSIRLDPGDVTGEPDVSRAMQHVMIAFGGEDYGMPRKSATAQRMHRLYFALHPWAYTVMFGLVLLTLFEQPVWSYNWKVGGVVNETRWQATDPTTGERYYPGWPFPTLRRYYSLPIEWLGLLCLIGFTGLRVYSVGIKGYMRNRKAVLFAFILALTVIDTLVVSICLLFDVRVFRIASYLRLVLLLLETPSVMRQLQLVARTAARAETGRGRAQLADCASRLGAAPT